MKISIFLFLLIPLLIEPPVFCEEKQEAYLYLNRLRAQVSLPKLKVHVALEKAAVNHADYLLQNFKIGHEQELGSTNFSGRTPRERAKFFGYPSLWVIENVSSGHDGYKSSIDQLMGAIYHRLAFLDLQKKEVGIGIAKGERGDRYVYKLGISLGKACNTGEIPSRLCIQKKSTALLKKLPEVTVWPPNGGTEIPAAFYNEAPDPMPNYRLTGYPISIQFNPAITPTATLKFFRVFEQEKNKQVQAKIITKYTDLNRKLTAHQFALFPLERLKWGMGYRIEAEFETDMGRKRVSSVFYTKKFRSLILEVRKNKNTLFVEKRRKKLILYFPPEEEFQYIEHFSWDAPAHLQLNLKWFDNNTLEIRFAGKCNDTVNLTLNSHRQHQLILRCELPESYERPPL